MMPDISMTMVWFILFIVFLVMELATAGPLISIWFCVGSLVALATAQAHVTVFVQIVVFLVVSTVLLVLTKPFVKKIVRVRSVKTNLDRVVGMHGIVTEIIDNLNETGAVKADGKVWSARNIESDQLIKEGKEVIIQEIQGVKVFVKEL